MQNYRLQITSDIKNIKCVRSKSRRVSAGSKLPEKSAAVLELFENCVSMNFEIKVAIPIVKAASVASHNTRRT